VLRPKLRRIARASAFEPSMMNKHGTAAGPLDVRPLDVRSRHHREIARDAQGRFAGTRPDFVLHFRSSSRDGNVDGLPTPRKFPACMVTARILSESGILDTTWHPLDGIPAPEYVPPTWDGPHAGKRLVDGLRTLTLMPMPRGPRASGSHWPAYAHDWADILAQQELQREVVGQVLGEFSDEAQNCTEKAIQRVRREFWTTLERRFAELNARVDVMVKAHREGSIRGG
jgi:hypothetical protein